MEIARFSNSKLLYLGNHMVRDIAIVTVVDCSKMICPLWNQLVSDSVIEILFVLLPIYPVLIRTGLLSKILMACKGGLKCRWSIQIVKITTSNRQFQPHHAQVVQ